MSIFILKEIFQIYDLRKRIDVLHHRFLLQKVSGAAIRRPLQDHLPSYLTFRECSVLVKIVAIQVFIGKPPGVFASPLLNPSSLLSLGTIYIEYIRAIVSSGNEMI